MQQAFMGLAAPVCTGTAGRVARTARAVRWLRYTNCLRLVACCIAWLLGMFKTLSRILLCLILLPVLVSLFAVAGVFYLLQDQPQVIRDTPVEYATVAAGKALVKRLKQQVEFTGDGGTTLAVTEAELDQLAQMGSYTFAWLDADVDVDETGIRSRLSVQLPDNPVGQYLNIGVRLAQSTDVIAVDQLSLGPLQIGAGWLLPLTARVLDSYLQSNQASLLLASVHGLRIEGDTALLHVSPPPDIKRQFKQAVRTLQASRFSPAEQGRVIHYYALLAALGGRASPNDNSLAAYVTPLFVEAAVRSKQGSAVDENRAAMWALIIFFSDGAFEALIGKVVSGQSNLVRSPPDVTLAARGDLLDHFIYSAGITLATQQGIGIAAGEFKELLDSGNGGSGFSFVDLAADRAGIAFVEAATASEDSARQFQRVVSAGAGETGFFPDIAGLLENLAQDRFRELYGSTDSMRYRRQLAAIDERIIRLPLYSGHQGSQHRE